MEISPQRARFCQMARKRLRDSPGVRCEHAQVIAGHRFNLDFLCQRSPDCERIVGQESGNCGFHENDLAFVELGAITPPRAILDVYHALECLRRCLTVSWSRPNDRSNSSLG